MAVLTAPEIDRINEESLRVLWETGVQVDDDGIAELLVEHGCVVDDSRVARIPRETVQWALAECPTEVKLVSLGGDESILRAGGESLFWTGNAVNLAIDDGVVPIDTERFTDYVHVLDGLEHIHAAVSTCLVDVPPPVRGLSGMRLIAENCLKHIRPCIYDPRETKGMIEMAHVLLDGATIAE
ncbi:MAG TPA: trimethylamine methyltransferase family protein, partial [Armatimonadota bacterium]|nr:trimethylamine methyltransferase family protein [Armatimonadota bacterium]